MEITLKSVKINRAMSDETTCFSATVYVRTPNDDPRALANPGYLGTKIGTVMNRGHGGSNEYHWTDRDLGRDLERWANDQTVSIPACEFMEEFELTFDKLDHFIDLALDAFETAQWFKRQCRSKTMFRLKEDRDPESWRTTNAPFTPEVKAWLVKQYSDDITEIANETRV